MPALSSACPFWTNFASDLQRSFQITDLLYTQPPANDGALLVACLIVTDLIVVKQELDAVLEALRERSTPGLRLEYLDIRLPSHGLRRIRIGPFTRALLGRLNRVPPADASIRDYVTWAYTHVDEQRFDGTDTALSRLMRIGQARVRWSLPAGAADRALLLHNGRTAVPRGHVEYRRTVTRYTSDATPSATRLVEVQGIIRKEEREGANECACRRRLAEVVTLWCDLTDLEELVRSLVLKWVTEEKDPHTILAYSSIAKGILRHLEALGATILDIPAISWLDYFSTLPEDDRQQGKRYAVLNDIRDLVGQLTLNGGSRREPMGYVRTLATEQLPQVEQLIRLQVHLPVVVLDAAVAMLRTAARYGLRSEELVTRTEATILRGDEDLVAVRRSSTFSGKSLAAYRLLAQQAKVTNESSSPVFVADGLGQNTVDEAIGLLGWALGCFGAVVHGLRTRALSERLARYFLPSAERAALDDTALLNAEAQVAVFAGHSGPGIVSIWYYDAQDRERRAWADLAVTEDLQRLERRGFKEGCDNLIARVVGLTPEAVRKRRSRLRLRHVALLQTFIAETQGDDATTLHLHAAAPDACRDRGRLSCGLAYLAARLGGVAVVEATRATRVGAKMQEMLERALLIAKLSKCNWSLTHKKREPLPLLAAAALPLLGGLPLEPKRAQIAAIHGAISKGEVLDVFDLQHLAALPPLAGLVPHLQLTVRFDPACMHIDDVRAACRMLGPIEVLAQGGGALAVQCAWRHPLAPGVAATRALYLAASGWWALNIVGGEG